MALEALFSRHDLLYIGAPKSCFLEEGPSWAGGGSWTAWRGMTNVKCKPRPKDSCVVFRLGRARWRGGNGRQF